MFSSFIGEFGYYEKKEIRPNSSSKTDILQLTVLFNDMRPQVKKITYVYGLASANHNSD